MILLGLLVGAIVELYVVILVAGWIGFWSMLGSLVLLSLIGFSVIRWAGARTMRRYTMATGANRDSAKEVADGALLLGAGVLLVIPGFVTALFGVLLLLPPVRALLRNRMSKRATAAAGRFGGRFGMQGSTIIATYERGDVQDTTGTDPFGELRDPRDRDR